MAVTTETGSEVIAQIALAWALKKSRALNVSDCVEVQKDNKGKPIMVDRSEETWNKNRDYQIEVLQKRVQG